jgi:hypothetical protein
MSSMFEINSVYTDYIEQIESKVEPCSLSGNKVQRTQNPENSSLNLPHKFPFAKSRLKDSKLSTISTTINAPIEFVGDKGLKFVKVRQSKAVQENENYFDQTGDTEENENKKQIFNEIHEQLIKDRYQSIHKSSVPFFNVRSASMSLKASRLQDLRQSNLVSNSQALCDSVLVIENIIPMVPIIPEEFKMPPENLSEIQNYLDDFYGKLRKSSHYDGENQAPEALFSKSFFYKSLANEYLLQIYDCLFSIDEFQKILNFKNVDLNFKIQKEYIKKTSRTAVFDLYKIDIDDKQSQDFENTQTRSNKHHTLLEYVFSNKIDTPHQYGKTKEPKDENRLNDLSGRMSLKNAATNDKENEFIEGKEPLFDLTKTQNDEFDVNLFVVSHLQSKVNHSDQLSDLSIENLDSEKNLDKSEKIDKEESHSSRVSSKSYSRKAIPPQSEYKSEDLISKPDQKNIKHNANMRDHDFVDTWSSVQNKNFQNGCLKMSLTGQEVAKNIDNLDPLSKKKEKSCRDYYDVSQSEYRLRRVSSVNQYTQRESQPKCNFSKKVPMSNKQRNKDKSKTLISKNEFCDQYSINTLTNGEEILKIGNENVSKIDYQGYQDVAKLPNTATDTNHKIHSGQSLQGNDFCTTKYKTDLSNDQDSKMITVDKENWKRNYKTHHCENVKVDHHEIINNDSHDTRNSKPSNTKVVSQNFDGGSPISKTPIESLDEDVRIKLEIEYKMSIAEKMNHIFEKSRFSSRLDTESLIKEEMSKMVSIDFIFYINSIPLKEQNKIVKVQQLVRKLINRRIFEKIRRNTELFNTMKTNIEQRRTRLTSFVSRRTTVSKKVEG